MKCDPVVWVVDDDPDVLSSTEWLLESVGLKCRLYSSPVQFLDEYDPSTPGCIVLDVRMPHMSGLEVQEKLRDRGLSGPIIFLTSYADVPMAVRAMKGGALDFFQKPVRDRQVLLDCIQRAIADDLKECERRELQRSVQERLARLTDRENEVLGLVVEGRSSREIAESLGVHVKTVEAHRANLMKKMKAKNVLHLARMQMQAEQAV